jgi:hypothetical protein
MPREPSLRRRIIVAVAAALLFGLGLKVWHMLEPFPRYKYGPGIFPMRAFHVRLARSQFDAFAQQMGRFAAAFGFEDLSRQVAPDPRHVLFDMRRSEVDLVGSDVTPKGAIALVYLIGFYPKHDRPPPPSANVNLLVEGLKKFLTPVDGAVLTETTDLRGP